MELIRLVFYGSYLYIVGGSLYQSLTNIGGFPGFTPSNYQEMIIHFLFRFQKNTNAMATITKINSNG